MTTNVIDLTQTFETKVHIEQNVSNLGQIDHIWGLIGDDPRIFF